MRQLIASMSVLLACLLVALLASAGEAGAAKGSGKRKPGPVLTQSATVQVPPKQLRTAVASCPTGSRAVGGGFSATPGGLEPTLVTESRRSGGRSWIVSGLRSGPLTTSSGELTAIVRCRFGAPRIRESAASTILPAAINPGDHPRGTVTAGCGGRRRAISGGFSSQADPKEAQAVLPQQSQRVAKGRGWSVSASHNNPTARELIAYAYCARATVRKRSGSRSITGDLTTESADTRACGPGLVAVSGGFLASKGTLTDGGNLIFVLASQPHGDGWRTTGMHSGPTSTGELRSFAYCG